MRNISLILFIASLLCCRTSAQSYQSIFGKDSTVWIVEWGNLDFLTYSPFSEKSDTLFNTTLYKKVVLNDYSNTFVLLREDTVTGRVWRVDPGLVCGSPDLIERLVMDMSLNLGDTFNISHAAIIIGYTDTLIVVDSVYYAEGLKHIRFKSPPDSVFNQSEPITFIEGVGPNYTVLWMDNKCIYGGTYLLCAYKDTTKENYSNLRYNGDCSPIIGGISSINTDEINISPNPTSNKLYINTSFTYFSVFIIDMMGRSWPAIFANMEIDVSMLPSGVYCLGIQTADGIVTKKFVKE